MLFDTPAKLQDGRYFLKITNDDGSRVMHQVNTVQFYSENLIPSDSTIFSRIDEAIVTQAKESKVAWFGKEISDETVISAYQGSINLKGELSASFATIKGTVVTTCFDTQKNTVELDQIVPGTLVDVLLELVGLVFTKRAFEPVWKMIQVRVKAPPRPRFPREYLFSDDVEPEEEEMDL